MPGFKKAASKARGRTTKKRKVESMPSYSRAGPARSKALKPEIKYFDSQLNNKSLVASAAWAATMIDPDTLPVASINTLFAPVEGSKLFNRVGRKVTVRKIKIRGYISMAVQTAQNTADPGSVIRLMLVQDKQTNVTQMTGAQLMGDVVSANTTVFSFQNPDQFGRFRVLKEKTIAMFNPNLVGSPTTADVVQGGLIKPVKMSIRFKKPVEVHFNATTAGTIGDIIDNSFHLVANCTSVTMVPQITYACRVTYTDV